MWFIKEKECEVSKKEAEIKHQFARIKKMEAEIILLGREVQSGKNLKMLSYNSSQQMRPIGHSAQSHSFNTGMYRSGRNSPARAMPMEQSREFVFAQPRPNIHSVAKSRIQSKPPSRQDFIAIPPNLMNVRQGGGIENIPKQVRRPYQMPAPQTKPQMIDLRDEPDTYKLGKRVNQSNDVENIEEDSPHTYQRGAKQVKKYPY